VNGTVLAWDDLREPTAGCGEQARRYLRLSGEYCSLPIDVDTLFKIYHFSLKPKNQNQNPLEPTPKPYTLYPKPEFLF
jgi:hypothetical protein